MAKEDIGYERTLKAGETLFREGEEGNEMYLIKSGKVRIVKGMEDMEKLLAVLEDGAFFGEMAVLDREPRSASAIAEMDTELIIVDRDVFLRSINENPFIKYIIGTLTERLRKTDDMLKYYSIPNEGIRLIYYLGDQIREGEEKEVDTGLSPEGKEIADMTGLSIEKIKKYLRDLEKFDIVEQKDTIIIKSPKKLKKYEEYIALREEFQK
ncbi:MAG: cyclic nucleotide-binding domain-containing protein [candidate division WOR-3 bacterium]|nr:cyclic nucleotide-binding domain-containing protein [candidate division WOR-3 bacterium]